jgi:SAM-dependent methyltransferase
MNKYEDANRELWDELTGVHVKSYGIERFKAGRSTLDEIQLHDLGGLKGKSLLHLQCHFGLDSLSLAREGAAVTAVDFSERAIDEARKLSTETGIPARFISSNIYDLEKHLDESFDVVYNTRGVLCWLKDINEWARIINRYLKPGGFFYIMETHPIIYIFEDTGSQLGDIIHPYFHHDEPKKWDDNAPDYSDPTFNWNKPSYEWMWNISDIINALTGVGLTIEFFNEYDKLFYKGHPEMERESDRWWVLPRLRGKLPFMFTLRARKSG